MVSLKLSDIDRNFDRGIELQAKVRDNLYIFFHFRVNSKRNIAWFPADIMLCSLDTKDSLEAIYFNSQFFSLEPSLESMNCPKK